MIKITLPDPFLAIKRWELSNYKRVIEVDNRNMGLYAFYAEDGSPLYVGKSRRLYSRLRNHVEGRGDSDRFSSSIAKIVLYPVVRLEDLDIYESYAISVIRPEYNKDKVFYSGEHQSELDFQYGVADGLIDLKRDGIDGLLYRQEEIEEAFGDPYDELADDMARYYHGELILIERELERERSELAKLTQKKGIIEGKLDGMTMQKG